MESGSASKRVRSLLLAGNVVLGAAMVLASSLLVRDLLRLSVGSGEDLRGPANARPVATPPRDLYYYRIVMEKNPFGFAAGELKRISAPPPPPSTEAPAQIAPNALLVGTVCGPAEKGFAVLVGHDGNQEVFAVGDPVFGIGKLQRIAKDKIIVLREGKRIEIPLLEVEAAGRAGAAPRETAKPSSDVRALEEEESASASEGGGEVRILDREMIRRAVENPQQILTEARLLPHLAQGRVQGFVLSEVKPNGIYDRLGLRNGDVLIRINEYEVTTPESALQAFRSIRESDLIEIDLLRNGSRLGLAYEIR